MKDITGSRFKRTWKSFCCAPSNTRTIFHTHKLGISNSRFVPREEILRAKESPRYGGHVRPKLEKKMSCNLSLPQPFIVSGRVMIDAPFLLLFSSFLRFCVSPIFL